MSMIKQWAAVVGTVMAVSAGCATQDDGEGQEEVIDAPDQGGGGSSSSALDAKGAAALDDKHAAAMGRAFDAPGTCYSVDVMAGRVTRLNVETQTATPVANLPQTSGHMLTSLGHFGGSLLACQNNEIAVYDLDGEAVKTVARPCQAVTGDGNHIWVMLPNQGQPGAVISEYTSFASLVEGQADRTLDVPFAFSLGAGAERLITAWHSTNEVNLVSLADGSVTTSPLQGYDDWIFGSNEAFGERYVVGGWSAEVRGLHVFDPSSGAGLGRMFADTWFAGLTCDNRE